MAAFRCARALRAVAKTTTGLVGVKVDPNARMNLIVMQKKLLEAVKVGKRRGCRVPTNASRQPHWATLTLLRLVFNPQIIPADVYYRQSVEKTANFRMKKATEIEDVRAPPPRRPIAREFTFLAWLCPSRLPPT